MLQDYSNQQFVRSIAGRCSCGGDKYIYRLSRRLDEDIIPYLQVFGQLAFDFATTHLLKIENTKYIITGVKRLKEIRFMLKNPTAVSDLELFETALACYLKKQ